MYLQVFPACPSIPKCLLLSLHSQSLYHQLLSCQAPSQGSSVSGAGGRTVAEPLVVSQYPFSPSIIIEQKLSPELHRTTTFSSLAAKFISSGAQSPQKPLNPEALLRQLFLPNILHLSNTLRGTDITAASVATSHSSFLRELRFCSGRRHATLNAWPSQRSLQGSHVT